MPSFSRYLRTGNGHLVDYAGINRAALPLLPKLVQEWFPDGKRLGSEYCALNPHRGDRHPGSFLINLRSGRWADFASGERGGDVVSLAAFRFGVRQVDAAKMLAVMLGVDWRR
jgi:hypothetical protein